MSENNEDRVFPKGAIALAMFSPAMRAAIIEYVHDKGNLAISDSAACARQSIQVDPALGFMSPHLPAHVLVCLARALRIVIGDALAGQWDTEKYAIALSRAGSIGYDEAKRIAADQIVTRDANVMSFARRLLQAAPEIPGPFDNAVGGVLGGVLSALEAVTPNDWVNSSGDVLNELYRMGKVMGELSIRAQLVVQELSYEKRPLGITYDTEGREVAAPAQAPGVMETLGVLGKAILGLVGMKMESGDISDDDRDEAGEILTEVGDLMEEYYRTRPDLGEQGGLGSFLKRVGRTVGKGVKMIGKAAPALGAIAGNVALPGLGGIAGGMLGRALSSPSHKQAFSGALAKADQFPPVPLNVSSGRVGLPDLIRSVQALRAAGVNLG